MCTNPHKSASVSPVYNSYDIVERVVLYASTSDMSEYFLSLSTVRRQTEIS